MEADLLNPTMKKLVFFSVAALLMGILFTGLQSASAQVPAPTPSDDEVNAIARDMYCPVCENIPLDVCPTQACAQWRDLIREKLALGWDETQIRDYFAAQYGDRVLDTPPARGLNWLVYVLPPLIFAAGVYLVYRVLRSNRAKKPQSDTVSLPVVDEKDPYVSRLEAELQEREKGGV